MNLKQTLQDAANKTSKFITRYSPQILAGVGIGFFGLAIVSTAVAAPKAEKKLEEKKEELKKEKLTPKETVETVWKDYAVSAAEFIAGVACVVTSAAKSEKRYVDSIIYAEGVREAFREFKEQTIKTVGAKKEKAIEHEINQDKVDKNVPEANVNVLVPLEDGVYRTLIHEPIANLYFWDIPDKFDAYVGRAMRTMNGNFDGELSFYEWLQCLPGNLTSFLQDGQADRYMNMGWTRDCPYEGFNAFLGDSVTVHGGRWDGFPCREICYDEDPVPNFR